MTKIGHNRWSMTIADLTRHENYTRTVRYSTPGQSAEAIHERPEVNGSLASLARTSTVPFQPSSYCPAGPGSRCTRGTR